MACLSVCDVIVLMKSSWRLGNGGRLILLHGQVWQCQYLLSILEGH